MTRSPLLPLLLAAFALPLAACDGGGSTPSRDGGLLGDAPAPCEEGLVQCRGRESWVCVDGVLTLDATCSEEQVCALGLGCRDCQPGRPLCVDGDVHLCGEDGTSTTPDRTCEGTSFCSMGACIDPCADAAEYGGEEGCAFVAPAGGEEATVVNRNDADVEVVLEVDGEEVARETLAPVSHVAITLPEAGLATLRTTRPVTAVRQGAEDAALWRPAHTFTERHRVVSWPGEEESRARLVALDTAAAQITLAAAARVGEVEAAAGETVMATLEPGAPLDLIAAPGVDLTGTLVEADGPVGLFVEVRGALAPRIDPEADPEAEPTIPAPPEGAPEEMCCGATLLTQPTAMSWGTRFLATPSPARAESWREPDLFRVVADVDVEVRTTLPAPHDTFTLEAGAARDLPAQAAFTLEADEPVALAQVLVAQAWLGEAREGRGGSPALALLTPLEGARRFVYLAGLGTLGERHARVLVPVGTLPRLDGRPFDSASCAADGTLEMGGTAWESWTCLVAPGAHLVAADAGMLVTAFGHDGVRSYAATAGYAPF